jgi:hypothetical protein
MFPFPTRSAWLRSTASAHTSAVAKLAEPLLDGDEKTILHDRARAYGRWTTVATILLAILLTGSLVAASAGLLAALQLTSVGALFAAWAGSVAGAATLAYTLVQLHVRRLEVDMWGVLAVAALRRTADT